MRQCSIQRIILLQMTGGNDISLIYPWVHISSIRQEIGLWLDKEEATMERRTEVTRSEEIIRSGEMQMSGRRRLSQGDLDILYSTERTEFVFR